ALLKPLPESTPLDARLKSFPTEGLPLSAAVTIRWNEHHVPFVEAQSDEDLAFALGLVHAHLRLAQMTILRRIVEGRLAESAGPIAADIDHALRTLDFGRGAAQFEAEMPAETRAFVTAFVRGINHYQAGLAERDLPHEFAVLALKREPWTVRHVLAIGRLAGTDINWLGYFSLLKLRARPDWPELYRRLLAAGGNSTASFAADASGLLAQLLAGASRNGSNAIAVSGTRTASGAALLGSDPHLGIQMPNLWLIAGMKSPSYHSVGFMIPGVPIVALGRNPAIAWGGTNMRAASSDLFDVSKLPPGAITSRTERIKVRWWFDRKVTVRSSPLGPVISDLPLLGWEGKPPFALRWVGHEKGDEITAMLKVQRARNWSDFRAAFATFAVSAQNMIYADAKGNIGQVMAAMLPVRKLASPPDLILDPADPAQRWQTIAISTSLPAAYNPKEGFLASANNRPTHLPFPVGYAFSADDRMIRMRQVMAAHPRVDLGVLKGLHRDVYVDSSVALRDAYLAAIRRTGADAGAEQGAQRVLALMQQWDGHYAADRKEPVAFELFHTGFKKAYYIHRYGAEGAETLFAIAAMARLILDDLPSIPEAELRSLLRDALAQAGRKLDGFGNWGEMHRLGLSHPLAFAPLIGRRYRFGDLPAGGSTESLMKTAHDGSQERHFTRYGQQARFVSDLADLDANYFLLLGGQDGWLGSTTALDQIPLWQNGGYIRMPLRPETVAAEFSHRLVLQPKR
ncbi:MAG: penicillin acylase family protein, partial [Rhodospirillaceae bacterium]|nr:penicillin acylase family protein [Rhodospirillaceae bacterium]